MRFLPELLIRSRGSSPAVVGKWVLTFLPFFAIFFFLLQKKINRKEEGEIFGGCGRAFEEQRGIPEKKTRRTAGNGPEEGCGEGGEQSRGVARQP